MILDSQGNPIVRRLGFLGGLEPERKPRTEGLVPAIGCDRVWPDEDGEGIESQKK